jgi:hypothetical protein
MVRQASLITSLALAAILPACAEDPTIEDRVSSYATELNDQIAIYCDCWDSDGFESFNDCTQAYGYLGPSQQDCYHDALSRDEEAAGSWLDCVLELERNYTACIDSRLTCGDYESDNACIDDYAVGYDACVQLPESISRGLDGCTPGE